jgi:hypothetical protein
MSKHFGLPLQIIILPILHILLPRGFCAVGPSRLPYNTNQFHYIITTKSIATCMGVTIDVIWIGIRIY